LNNRHSFEKIITDVELPNLLDLQVGSFHDFLQEDVKPKDRVMFGLHEAFDSIFPLQDNHENYILEYKSYTIGKARYTPRECSDRGITYNVPLSVKLRLKITDEKDKKKFAQVIDQDVYFGNMPYMTGKGTFIINGAERTVVTQLQRSPGAFFDQKFHPNGAKLFNARIIPIRGSWIDFTTDINDILFTNNIINTTNLAHVGALVFVIFAFLSRRVIEEAESSLRNDIIFDGDKNSNHPLAIILQNSVDDLDSYKKIVSVEALNYALILWEEVTGKDKLSLAEESKFWRITNDGGTLKTRTLDKYLKLSQLPQNPRYSTVAKTLKFIALLKGTSEYDCYWLQKVAKSIH
jgi:DNA-directed RNA polymerase beta subunit